MSRLRIFAEHDPASPLEVIHDHAAIAERLGALGVRFERWEPGVPVAPGDPPERILHSYRADIDRLMAEGGYRTADVVSLAPDHPDREALRRKFLAEHRHGEDEVRCFAAGAGLFSLHLGERVYELLCTAGDLVGVPEGTPHWFDMGPRPSFVAIRLFTNPEGWVAEFTGSDIASRFPRYEPGAAA